MDTDIHQLGLDAARQVLGADAVKQVEVIDGADYWYRPAYHFTYLIDLARSQLQPGLVRTRLIQKLLDDLDARGDDHLPVIQLLDAADWEKRARA